MTKCVHIEEKDKQIREILTMSRKKTNEVGVRMFMLMT